MVFDLEGTGSDGPRNDSGHAGKQGGVSGGAGDGGDEGDSGGVEYGEGGNEDKGDEEAEGGRADGNAGEDGLGCGARREDGLGGSCGGGEEGAREYGADWSMEHGADNAMPMPPNGVQQPLDIRRLKRLRDPSPSPPQKNPPTQFPRKKTKTHHLKPQRRGNTRASKSKAAKQPFIEAEEEGEPPADGDRKIKEEPWEYEAIPTEEPIYPAFHNCAEGEEVRTTASTLFTF